MCMVKSDRIGKQVAQTGERIQIPIFYKMMVSMLFVAIIPILLLSIVAVGGIQAVIAAFGLVRTIVLITLITIIGILIVSYYLSLLIARPIVQLSQVANDLSRGVINEPDLPVTRNDEIGNLSRAFQKMMNTYRLLDTLAQDQQPGSSRGYLKE